MRLVGRADRGLTGLVDMRGRWTRRPGAWGRAGRTA
ncbi:hypothetical protein GA0115260_1002020, partial [Streptomyces sp. MnatMP-M27]